MGKIAYQLLGEGPGRVVFLHGLMGRGRNFGTIALGLGDEFCSMLVDLPNHGASDWTASFDYVAMADAVAELIRTDFALANDHPEPVALVGHSMGGKVAMIIALRHPELIERLAVVDIAPGLSGTSTGSFQHLLGSLLAVDLCAVTRRSDADAQLSSCIPNPVVRQFLLQNLRSEAAGYRWQANVRMLYDALGDIVEWPDAPWARGSGAGYQGPVVWIAGAKSDYVRPENAPLMHKLFPRVRRVTIHDAGHWVHSEQPERFLSTLRYFLTQPAASVRG